MAFHDIRRERNRCKIVKMFREWNFGNGFDFRRLGYLRHFPCFAQPLSALAGSPFGPMALFTRAHFSPLTTAPSIITICSSLLFRMPTINSVGSALQSYCSNLAKKELISFANVATFFSFMSCLLFVISTQRLESYPNIIRFICPKKSPKFF